LSVRGQGGAVGAIVALAVKFIEEMLQT